MRRRLTITTLLMLLFFSCSGFFHSNEVRAEQNKNVLLIYDSLALGTSREGNIDALKRLLVTFGVDVITINSENYQNDMVYEYSYVIIMRNNSGQHFMTDELIEDMKQFKGKYLHIGADPPASMTDALKLKLDTKKDAIAKLTLDHFSGVLQLEEELNLVISYDEGIQTFGTVQLSGDQVTFPYSLNKDNYTYVSYYKGKDLSEWALGYVISDWLDKEQTGNMYLMLTEVYPFSDLQQLRDISDILYQSGIPFLVTANPLFNNFDYPAAQRYVETLSYMQSRNGSIIVDAPAVSSQTISADLSTLKNDIAAFINFLADNGVAPLAASAELYWFEDDYYIPQGLSFYDSAIVLPNEKIMRNQPNDTLQAFASSIYTMDLDNWQQYAKRDQIIENMPINIALMIDTQEYSEDMNELLQWLAKSWILFADYKTFPHTVTTDATNITAHQGLLTINEQMLKLKDTYEEIEPVSTDLVQTEASLQGFFSIQNKIFIVIIIFVLIFFSILLVIGYRMYRKKY